MKYLEPSHILQIKSEFENVRIVFVFLAVWCVLSKWFSTCVNNVIINKVDWRFRILIRYKV